MVFNLSKAKWVLIFTYMSMFVLGISDNIRGPLYPELLKYFNLNNSEASLSFAFASGAAFFGNGLGALILKKIHLDRLLTISIFLMMSGLFIMGMSSQFNIYLFGTIIYGFSLGSTGVAQNLLIAENSNSHNQTKSISGLHGIYGLSSFIAPFLASRAPIWFSDHSNGWTYMVEWQSAFFITCAIAFVVLVLLLIVSPKPAFIASLPHDELIHGKKSSIATMLWFAGFFASYVGAEILISTRLALYMRTYFNMSLEESSNYVSYFFIFLLAGRLLFAFKSFKMSLKKQLYSSLMLSLAALIVGLFIHPFFLAILGFTMAPFYPLAIVYISDITGFQKRRFLTFVMGLQSLSVIIMHIGVGYLTDAYGLLYAFGVGVALLIGSILCLYLHPKVLV